MKTVINNTQGVVTYRLGDKIILESTSGIEIKGDLTIQGTTTTNARVDDRIIELAYGSTGSANSAYDAGIVINRGDDDNVFFGWDESADLFKVATGTFTGASTENLSLNLGGMQSLSLTSNSLTGSNTITVPDGGLILGSTAVGSTAAELNLLDGSAKSTSSITVADDDAILIIDGNTTKQIPASDLKTYVGSTGAITLTTAAQTNVTSLGTLTALEISGDLTVDTSTLKVDSANNRVGIGTASPATHLDVFGNLQIGNGGGGAHLQFNSTNLYFNNVDNGIQASIINGKFGIGTTEPTEKLDIDSDAIRIRTPQTPASAAAAGVAGMIAWDENYIYVCVDTNTWKRVAIGTW